MADAMQHEQHNSLTSTNDRAMQIARAWPRVDEAEPVCVSAVTQTAGRGRNGRAWSSDDGGAWFSVAWPWVGDLAHAAAAPLVVGAAVRSALLSVASETAVIASDKLQIKWPNDLLLDGRKLAGILCEQAVAPTWGGTGVDAAFIVGVGINVNQPMLGRDESFRAPAVSLRDYLGGQLLPVDRVIQTVAEAIAGGLSRLQSEGLDAAQREAIESCLAYRGQEVTLWPIAEGDAIQAVLVGLDPAGSGGLCVLQAGKQYVVTTGEIGTLRPGRASPTGSLFQR